jgi:hypothetical protein
MLNIGSTQYHAGGLTLGIHHLVVTATDALDGLLTIDYAQIATHTTPTSSSSPTSVYVFDRILLGLADLWNLTERIRQLNPPALSLGPSPRR